MNNSILNRRDALFPTTSNLSVNTENKNVVWHSTMTEHILCLMNNYKEQDFEPITFLGGQDYHK